MGLVEEERDIEARGRIRFLEGEEGLGFKRRLPLFGMRIEYRRGVTEPSEEWGVERKSDKDRPFFTLSIEAMVERINQMIKAVCFCIYKQ